MVFWVTYFTDFHWRQFSKSWTPSFLPYPCSSTVYVFCYFLWCLIKNTKRHKRSYQPLCVSFYYIIYIVNICIFEWHILHFLLTPIFKKLDAFIPALPLLGKLSTLLDNFVVFHNKSSKVDNMIPTPVCFFLLYYIYSKYMFFWVSCFTCLLDANFQKAGRLHSCLIVLLKLSYLPVFLCATKTQANKTTRCTNPCVFLFIVLYI